jgi:hypothetical protein
MKIKIIRLQDVPQLNVDGPGSAEKTAGFPAAIPF